jgi:hypothetical protein
VIDWIKAGGTLADFEELAARVWKDEPPPSPDEENARIEAASSSAVQAVIDRFNTKFMMVNEGGKAVIYQPGYDPILKRRHFDRLHSRDLVTLYLNELVQTGVDEKRRPVYKCVADVWLRHPRRRQYVAGVVFDPRNQNRPGVLNLWEGFAVKHVAGDWSLMKDHICKVICDGDPIRYDYLIGWIARMFQCPAEQGEVAVVLKGDEGTGKGTLAKAIIHIMGQHGLLAVKHRFGFS